MSQGLEQEKAISGAVSHAFQKEASYQIGIIVYYVIYIELYMFSNI